MKTKVVVWGRWSYVSLFEPAAQQNPAEEPKYTVQLIIDKNSEDIPKIEAAIQAALEEGKEKKFNGRIPRVFKNPLRDGDEERFDDENYANAYFMTAKSNTPPDVVDKRRQPILDKSQVYSGCYGYLSLNFYAFNVNSVGVAVALNNAMKTHEGEPLAGKRTTASEDFGEIAFEDDDDMD